MKQEIRDKISKTMKGRKPKHIVAGWNKGIKTGPNPEHSKRMTGKKMPSTSGEKHWAWKGGNVSLKSLHEWVRNKIIEPSHCSSCKKEKKLDLANISQKYLRNLEDWEWLCRRCHMTKDGRIGMKRGKYKLKARLDEIEKKLQ